MDVFVIPAAPDRYELYYEHTTEVELDDEPGSGGFISKLQKRFGELLRAAEQHRRRQDRSDGQSWTGRMQDRLLSWIAKRIAEQRLLWNLRKQERVVAVHPSDTTLDDLLPHIQSILQRDFERHRFWLFVDTLGLLVSAVVAIVPGPNLLAYYFIFRVGGHWFSMRGALHGRSGVKWEGQPCASLDGLRAAARMPRCDRQALVQQIASALHLRHLPTFFERVVEKNTTRAPGFGAQGSGYPPP